MNNSLQAQMYVLGLIELLESRQVPANPKRQGQDMLDSLESPEVHHLHSRKFHGHQFLKSGSVGVLGDDMTARSNRPDAKNLPFIASVEALNLP
ncbi:hypothetical protein SORBI_3006G016350 [Sorghum bicolor]|uniref:Uncharacterized protein n=1 Tax=Sorghum bicolor TaxID=4558 RepID=A0A1Z5RC36_SORBI|nr:hypothetical protein SORBI_3006G016350 [Sorghum bicolor]